MIKLVKSENDHQEFIEKAEKLIHVTINDFKPEEVFIIQVDNWFDKKWLSFSGKSMGAISVWNYDEYSKVPPFNPNRIVTQKYYQKDEKDKYLEEKSPYEVHVKQNSEDNLRKAIVQLSKSALFVWYSGGTSKNSFGSLMIYPVLDDYCEPFYIGFEKRNSWEIVSAPGSNIRLLNSFLSY